ncbi:aminotransferase class I/II-fold pyridoxal phosphate-dependent enzyme [Paenibacillus faecalis]|uniref:aminotransferase class I/II-fold pyridoxal phosphate-dependent enzyme n=1 Tax=Paenibacillus faecalis TaxID=2079532 RepID=UPI000D10F817|nr:pyridoxal phosphate-dependent aminotransferase family protein [Paenibacillus faecalis]
MDVFDKCIKWDFVKKLRLNDAYPYFKPIQEKMGTRAIVDHRHMIMIGSNDYLGLSGDSRIVQASFETLQRYGASSCGSRFLNGTTTLHIELEEQLAQFMNREKAIVFSTGYQTNLGVISSILGRNDVAIIDRQVHASIIDALRLASCKILRFKHNDMEDLEKKLKTVPKDTAKLIIVDGVFSMEGDIANLRDIITIKRQYGARLLVDDAHGIGILGKYGRGTGEYFNVESEIDLITGTFSKSFGSLGGFVAGDLDIVDYIQHQGRSMIFSASMTPASVGASLKALEIIRNEPERRHQLNENTKYFISGLRALGFNTGNSETPIVPIHIGDTMRTFVFWKRLMHSGIYTNPIISPAVQEGNELLRTSLMSTHTKEELNTALRLFEEIGLDLGIISGQKKKIVAK